MPDQRRLSNLNSSSRQGTTPVQKSQRFIIWSGLLPVLLAAISYLASTNHARSVEVALGTEGLIRQLDLIMTLVQAAETGQRGYLLTGQASYLEPFRTASANLPDTLRQTEKLAWQLGVRPEQYNNLNALIAGKTAEMNLTLTLKQTQGTEAAIRLVATNRGQRLMTEIHDEIGRLTKRQEAALAMRMKAEERSQDELETLLFSGVALSVLLLCFAFWFNRQYARERDRSERQVLALNETLELRVRERTGELESQKQELEKRTAELQRSNADLTQFAYVASHDLQEPLRMVGSYMGLLGRRYKGKLDDTADRYMQFAIEGAQRMQTLIQDLLSYSRAGTQALEKKTVLSKEIVETAMQNLDLAIRETSALIEYDNDLPAIEGDSSKLVQVMQNLFANAIKFRKAETAPHISVTARRANDRWEFAVRDNGIGFENQYSERIFQMFQRLHVVGEYAGNGIGLAICRRIIEHHGGQLWGESRPDEGSTFFFTLPISNESSPILIAGKASF